MVFVPTFDLSKVMAFMKKPTLSDIKQDLMTNYGHIVGDKRRLNIKLADAVYRFFSSKPILKLQSWYKTALKMEEGVLQSYDRMAGVYNTENDRLFSDESVVLCKHNKQYAYLKMKDAYKEQLDYAVEHVYKPFLENGMTALEVGAGETTTIHNLIKYVPDVQVRWSALELSWSRIAEGKRWSIEHNTHQHFDTMVAASALNIPFADNTFDLVFTNGCIEQIRYNTEQALSEVLRIAKKRVILYEPTYELGDRYQRIYLDGAQYCRGVPDILKKLGAKVTRYELAPHSLNPFCCYSITIIDKVSNSTEPTVGPKDLCCPKCKAPLENVPDGLYCASLYCSSIYPVIWGVPCLRIEDAVFASQYHTMLNSQSREESTCQALLSC